jgi:type I restriction enzyme S subunit
LNYQQIKGFLIPWPTEGERAAIAKRLSTINQDQLLERNTLDKYRLLKAGLMQDLLTGRVSVENVVHQVESETAGA